MVSIQCVNAEIKRIVNLLENNSENGANLEQLLLTYDLAADELKEEYEQLRKEYVLPQYGDLIN